MNPKDAVCMICHISFKHTDERVYYDSITAKYICRECWGKFR